MFQFAHLLSASMRAAARFIPIKGDYLLCSMPLASIAIAQIAISPQQF